MTDEIDLDELDAGSEDEEERPEGDWFWRDEGDVDSSASDAPTPDAADADAPPETDAGTGSEDGDAGDADGGGAVPHVPYADKGKPAGIPKASGGSGGGAGGEAGGAEPPEEGSEASGPHGGGADDMTLALTYGALKRLEDPAHVFADANAWADWLGIVGDVPTHVINKFQREHTLDADFFNGSGMGPRERLADVDRHSMFYADRFVLVGCEGEEEWAPEGWEFVPLEEAAGKAGWDWTDG